MDKADEKHVKYTCITFTRRCGLSTHGNSFVCGKRKIHKSLEHAIAEITSNSINHSKRSY